MAARLNVVHQNTDVSLDDNFGPEVQKAMRQLGGAFERVRALAQQRTAPALIIARWSCANVARAEFHGMRDFSVPDEANLLAVKNFFGIMP